MNGYLIGFLLCMSFLTFRAASTFLTGQGIKRAVAGVATMTSFTLMISPWLVPMYHEYQNYKEEYDALISRTIVLVVGVAVAAFSAVIRYGRPSLVGIVSPQASSPVLDILATPPAPETTKSDDFAFSPPKTMLVPVRVPDTPPRVVRKVPIESKTQEEVWECLEKSRAAGEREEQARWDDMKAKDAFWKQEDLKWKSEKVSLPLKEIVEIVPRLQMPQPAITPAQPEPVLLPNIPVPETQIMVRRDPSVFDGLSEKQRQALYPTPFDQVNPLFTLSIDDQATLITKWLSMSADTLLEFRKRPTHHHCSPKMAWNRLANQDEFKVPVVAVCVRYAFLLQWVTHGNGEKWDMDRLGDQWVISNIRTVEKTLENATWMAQGWSHMTGCDYLIPVRNAVQLFRNAMLNMDRASSGPLSAVNGATGPYTAPLASAPAQPQFAVNTYAPQPPSAPFQQSLTGQYGSDTTFSGQDTSSAQPQLLPPQPTGSDSMSQAGNTFSAAHKQPAPSPAAPVLPQPAPQPASIPAGTKAIPPTFSGLGFGSSRPVASSAPTPAPSLAPPPFQKWQLDPTVVWDNLKAFATKTRIPATGEKANALLLAWTNRSIAEVRDLASNIDSMSTLKGVQCLKYITNRFEQMDRIVGTEEDGQWDDGKYSKEWMEQNGVFEGMDELERMLKGLSEKQHVRAIDEEGAVSGAWNAVDNVCRLK